MITGYTAYFDVSRGRDPIYTMAGYIGRVEKGESFRIEWKLLLESENVHIFNAADLESQVGEFYNWSNRRKISFQQRAYKIINDVREIAIGHSISVSDFESLKLKWIREPHKEAKSHLPLWKLVVEEH